MSLKNLLNAVENLRYRDFGITQELLENLGLRQITLRDYQLFAVNWIVQRFASGNGCILADEMGLGKTCTTIASLLYIMKKEKTRRCLVISPTSVLNNWKSEFERFAPILDLLCYAGDREERQELSSSLSSFSCILTTYELFYREKNAFTQLLWDVVVLDEAQRVKNKNSKTFSAVQELRMSFIILLTGTPIQNNMTELYALLHLVAPRIFTDSMEFPFVDEFSTSSSKELLTNIIKNFVIRRVKAQVLRSLPEKSEVVIFHGLTKLQKQLYRCILQKNINFFTSENIKTSSNLEISLNNVLMHLRKCILHPYLFQGVEPEPFENGEHLVNASGKLLLLDKIIEYLVEKGHKALIFSQFTSMLDIIQDYMTMRQYNYERLDGSVRREERFIAVDMFNNSAESQFFLLSTKAGGVGLNLTAADTVIFTDIDFNPQNDMQAASRCHRIGQEKNVKVIRLICKDSVEELIFKRCQKKLMLANSVLANPTLSYLDDPPTKNELLYILQCGVEKIVENPLDDDITENFLDELPSENGAWKVVSGKQDEDVIMDLSEEEDNIYQFEGLDYSKPKKSLESILEDASGADNSDFAFAKKLLPPSVTKGGTPRTERKVLSPEEKKRLALNNLIIKNEKKRQLASSQWACNGYISCRLKASEETVDFEGFLDNDVNEIFYKVGDCTQPREMENTISIICVDDSGSWGFGRLFESVTQKSDFPKEYYHRAKLNNDLYLCDVHLLPFENDNTDQFKRFIALLIVQRRTASGISALKLDALEKCFQALYSYVKNESDMYSLHFPRIGYNMKSVDWYSIEKLIMKYFSFRGTRTFIYYFPRKNAKRSTQSHDDENFTFKVTKLANIFENIHAYFLPSNEKSQIDSIRLFVAYGGIADKIVNEKTKYIIIGKEDDLDDSFNNCKLPLVQNKWITFSAENGELADESNFALH